MTEQEQISVFDMFKIGVGPSSSHTLGPWRAARLFIQYLEENNLMKEVQSVKVDLYGSLAKTGKGHGTDIAVQLGLLDEDPVTFDVNSIVATIKGINTVQKINLAHKQNISFDPSSDIEFHFNESLARHPNALTISATKGDGTRISKTYYSVGGGFVEQENESASGSVKKIKLKYPIDHADELLQYCTSTGMNISEVVMENEKCWKEESLVREGVLQIWHVMAECIYRGIHAKGELPGGLNVARRAAQLNTTLTGGKNYNSYSEWIALIHKGEKTFKNTLDWVTCFALAVNEENASFGRVVTAPTNGAAGVIPAVLFYHVLFNLPASTPINKIEDEIIRFLLTASEIGSIFKKGATISAAMGGCQAEIGVSSAMAAGALAERLGGSPQHVVMAAEIAMEHHLGMTCDPIRGLVQIPCIERNTMGAIKAITAAQLALHSDPSKAKVTLDDVVKTMWHTALDMNTKFKETAEGGLATAVPLGLSEC